ncbi:hypothetical protein BD779DRAFT_1681635 [Infundibulicybe gibba]|nr:hypothetical protein BD779DRAFT_1681635 [Infundibulicybe gibba]
MFYRNDPMNDPMNVPANYDGCGSPKPDVVLTALDAVRAAFPDQLSSAGWDDFAFSTTGDPPKCHLGWEGVLSSQKFELTRMKRSTLRRRYKMGDSPLSISPQPILDSGEDSEPDEVATDGIEAGRLLDSGESKVFPCQTLGGSCLGKRKRDVESRIGSLKRLRESTGVLAMLQSASYAAERMSRAFWVTHSINLVIINDVAYVWYYDDQHSVQSFGINFLCDLPYFLVLLFAFQRFSFQNWGVVGEFQKDKTAVGPQVPSDGHISPRCFSTWLDPLELWCLLQKQPTFDQHEPRGRRTQTLETTGSSQGPSHITKTLEGVGTVSKFSRPQGSRVLKIKTECMLRVTLFRRSYPITDLVGEEFWSVFWECFRCEYTPLLFSYLRTSPGHLRLWQCGIHHCIISISNLMCDKTTNGGILNDFDLVQPRDHPFPSKTPWAGMAMPFMALDLLQTQNPNMKREYHHNVESFAWVLLWICCTYENGEEIRERPLQTFTQPDFHTTYEEKLVLHEMGNLKPTASYSNRYYCAALNILAEYNLRHFKAARKYHSNLHRRRTEPNRPESIPNELADIEANLQICREAVAYVGLHVDL